MYINRATSRKEKDIKSGLDSGVRRDVYVRGDGVWLWHIICYKLGWRAVMWNSL